MKKYTSIQILRALRRVPENSPYRLGSKVLIVRVADNLNTTVSKLTPSLIELQKKGEIELARADLTGAFDIVPKALKRSFIPLPGHSIDSNSGWHFIRDPDFAW